MSQQYPQQPYPPQQPGWTPPPPKKNSVGKYIGLGCAGIIGLFIAIGIISAIASSGGDSNDSSTATATTSTPAASKAAEKDTAVDEKPAVAVTAKKTTFAKTILADGSNYTSVLVTITNNSSDTISVNPLYITITDTTGAKHTAELGVDEKQIDTVKLAPGENVSGVVTGEGKFTAKYVTYTDGLIGDSVRANVS